MSSRGQREQRRQEISNSQKLCKLALDGDKYGEMFAFLNQLDALEKQRVVTATFNGIFPLHFAVRGANTAIVRFLLTLGGEEQVQKTSSMTGETALHLAASRGNVEMTKMLIKDFGADPLTKDGAGFTALDRSRQNGFFDLANQIYTFSGFHQCRLGCGTFLPLRNLANHETCECPKATVACPACRLLMSVEDYHKEHECEKQLIQCSLCKDFVPAKEIAAHDEYCSSNTTRACPKCDLKIPILHMVQHKLDACPERELECSACSTWIKAKDRTYHVLKQCPKRLVDCEWCGLNLPFRAFAHHMDSECPERPVKCRFGCNTIAKAVVEHEAEHLRKVFREWTVPEVLWWLDLSYFSHNDQISTVHRQRIRQIFDNNKITGNHLCKLWKRKLVRLFGRSIKRSEISHFLRHLEKVKIFCPRNCGELLHLGNMQEHKDFCSQRIMRCLRCGMPVLAASYLEHKTMCVGSERRRQQTLRRRGPSSSLPRLPVIPGDIADDKRIAQKLAYDEQKRRENQLR